MKQTTVGYIVKFSTESPKDAWKIYEIGGPFRTKKLALKSLRKYKENGDLDYGESLSILKVVLEEI